LADTAGKVARLIQLHVPTAPYFLVMFWLDQVYKDACSHFASWSWLRAQSQIITNVAKTGTCNVTFGSTLVNDLTMGVAATDVNRQFRVGSSSPIYTILSVDTTVSPANFTLDQVYGAPTASATAATIGDFYITMPTDFARFIDVLDPLNNWRLRYWITEEELNSWDSQRSATGTPRVLASRILATTAAQAGQVQYELWPYQLNQYVYPMYYVRQPENLTDSTVFLGPLAQNGAVLLTGVLARCAAWPGLDGKKNPYYNLALAIAKEKEYQHELGQLENRDQEIYPSDWEAVSWINRASWAPLDAKFMMSHDSGLIGQGSGLGFETGFGSF
jgi:hypothetical protein